MRRLALLALVTAVGCFGEKTIPSDSSSSGTDGTKSEGEESPATKNSASASASSTGEESRTPQDSGSKKGKSSSGGEGSSGGNASSSSDGSDDGNGEGTTMEPEAGASLYERCHDNRGCADATHDCIELGGGSWCSYECTDDDDCPAFMDALVKCQGVGGVKRCLLNCFVRPCPSGWACTTVTLDNMANRACLQVSR